MLKVLTAQIREIFCLVVSNRRDATKNGRGATKQIKRNRWSTGHLTAHPQKEQSEAEKCSYGVDWRYNSLWYGPSILYSKSSKNVQDVPKNHQGSHEKLKGELKAEWKTFAEVKTQRSFFQRDSTSLLLYLIAMMPFNQLLRKYNGGL